MSRQAEVLDFVDFKDVCSGCTVNCCRRFYAVLLPEEEEEFRDNAFTIETPYGPVKAIGARNGKPCPYIDSRGFCIIYSKRPFDCRLWPVIVYIDFKTGERVIYLDLDCPAVSMKKIPPEILNKIIDSVKKLRLDDEWLKKYTLAPWPNHLIEIHRYKSTSSSK
ncbi:MAG: YkgJ family cysteine cluster protein [Thermoprotei archaeon]